MKTILQNKLLIAQKSGQLQGHLTLNESLAQYTTWRIGGLAECCYRPKNDKDIQAVLESLPENTAVNWVGLGSNLLVRDGGVQGLVIITNGTLNQLNFEHYDPLTKLFTITAEAGVACAIFSRKSARHGISGAEFLSGIPGTMGGALAMNAGAFGSEIWNYVTRVTMINIQGCLIYRNADEFNIKYRQVSLKKASDQEWFLRAEFEFTRDAQSLQQSQLEIKNLLAKRAATQPTKQANAGSVFKNPDNDYAARLIEASGLKGKIMNGAQISAKHANFIVNNGTAKAKDIEALMSEIKEQVLLKHQVTLESEIRIIGEY